MYNLCLTDDSETCTKEQPRIRRDPLVHPFWRSGQISLQPNSPESGEEGYRLALRVLARLTGRLLRTCFIADWVFWSLHRCVCSTAISELFFRLPLFLKTNTPQSLMQAKFLL